MEITNVSGGFTRNVPIDTMPLGIVRLSPKQVTVTGEMGTIAERSFAGIPVETGAGAITSFIVTPARVSVAVRGPEERVQALTRDSLRVVAHIAGSIPGVARITVIAPRGITARAIPDSVTLRRRATPTRRADVVLGIETSCDETSAAVLVNGELASLVILSQDIHKIFAASCPSWRAGHILPRSRRWSIARWRRPASRRRQSTRSP